MENHLAVLKNEEIRWTRHADEWWFVVEDVVRALTGLKDPNRYIRRMKKRDPELGKGWGQIVTPLPIETADSFQKMDCANLEGIFRIIQSIRTPKPEPYKQWLAKVGYEWIQEFLDPESVSRHRRTDTAPGSVQTPGLRKSAAHMANLEIIFSMLGEAVAMEIARKQDTKRFEENSMATRKGGQIAKKIKKELEAVTARKTSMHRDYLETPGNHNRIKYGIERINKEGL